ncbi:unnamed protein product [Tuber aestivum]|uniref:Uncharacterized protein n=1 Tax=Tuber aestivum TaxID=59557 RepID=A0A292PUP5_9PEZI|nr:unnamed protein product [Tuber aestivum]
MWRGFRRGWTNSGKTWVRGGQRGEAAKTQSLEITPLSRLIKVGLSYSSCTGFFLSSPFGSNPSASPENGEYCEKPPDKKTTPIKLVRFPLPPKQWWSKSKYRS